MSLSVRRLLTLVGLLVSLGPRGALALGPTKEECVEANEKAQALRQEDRLQAARQSLALCLASSCPGPVRQDCADRIAEIDRVLPTLVFDVKDQDGHDVMGVALKLDGKLLVSSLGGAAVPVDPGTHEVTLVPTVGAEQTLTLVVHEGEKARRVAVALVVHPLLGAGAGAADAPGRTQRVAGLVVGGAGVLGIVVGSVLGIVAKSTYDSAVSSDCGGDASHCSSTGLSHISSAHGQAAASTGSFVAGGVLAATGVTLFVTARQAVIVAPTSGGGVLTLRAAF